MPPLPGFPAELFQRDGVRERAQDVERLAGHQGRAAAFYSQREAREEDAARV